MKTYVGTKTIQAEPMKFLAFQKKKGALHPNVPDKEGYCVVYEDGYESWSPKDVFEKAYHEFIKDDRLLTTPVYPSGVMSIFSANDPTYGGGHRYQFLNSIGFSKGAAGYVESRQEISFVRKEEDGTMTPGLQSEQLVIALLDRHKKLNAQYPSEQYTMMVEGLQLFLDACKERVQDRIARGVMGDLKK